MKAKILILLAALVVLVMAFASCDVITENIFPNTHEHKWEEATCTSPKTCSECKETEGEALGHTEIVLEGRDATCTEAGLTDGKRCSVCGEILKAEEAIPATSHTEETVAGRAPTCTEAGLTEGKKCSVCGETLTAQESIPAAHIEEILAAKAPTCTETGLTEGKKCTACGEILKAQENIEALGHTDEDGDFKCDTCEAELCTTHSPAEPIKENTVEATCTSEGSYDKVIKCSVCGDEISREKVDIPVLPHTEETVAGKAPTCTEAGLTEGKKCSVCGETLTAQEDIPATSHREETVAGKDATCTESGLTEGKKCSVCGEILTAQEEIPAVGHKDNDGNFRCDFASCNVIIGENILAGNVFIPTAEANNVIYNQYFGYPTLTDGVISNDYGRFSTKDGSSIVDATVDLKANYALSYIKLYYYIAFWEGGSDNYSYVGADLKLEALNNGTWTTVFNYTYSELAQFVVSGETVNAGDGWLEICLNGVRAEQVRISSTAGNGKSISYYEIEILADRSTKQNLPEFNVLDGKEFVPTEAANSEIYNADYGYAKLTDGVISNDYGRFSTKGGASPMDATVDLEADYALSYIRLYYFFEWWRVASNDYTYVGADLKLEVLNDGSWTTVFNYTYAELAQFVVSGGANGAGDGWLEIDLNGVVAEQVRISSTAGNGTSISYYEIELYAKRATIE